MYTDLSLSIYIYMYYVRLSAEGQHAAVEDDPAVLREVRCDTMEGTNVATLEHCRCMKT